MHLRCILYVPYLFHHNVICLPSHQIIGMNNLDQLVLNHNQIQVLKAGMFEGLHKLHDLKVTNNHIHDIHDEAFEGLEGKYTFLISILEFV